MHTGIIDKTRFSNGRAVFHSFPFVFTIFLWTENIFSQFIVSFLLSYHTSSYPLWPGHSCLVRSWDSFVKIKERRTWGWFHPNQIFRLSSKSVLSDSQLSVWCRVFFLHWTSYKFIYRNHEIISFRSERRLLFNKRGWVKFRTYLKFWPFWSSYWLETKCLIFFPLRQ